MVKGLQHQFSTNRVKCSHLFIKGSKQENYHNVPSLHVRGSFPHAVNNLIDQYE